MAASVAGCFSARRRRRRSPSSITLRVAAWPRSFASSVAAEPISLATVLATVFAASFASFGAVRLRSALSPFLRLRLVGWPLPSPPPWGWPLPPPP